jgi:hypothetical protein
MKTRDSLIVSTLFFCAAAYAAAAQGNTPAPANVQVANAGVVAGGESLATMKEKQCRAITMQVGDLDQMLRKPLTAEQQNLLRAARERLMTQGSALKC